VVNVDLFKIKNVKIEFANDNVERWKLNEEMIMRKIFK